MAYIDELSSRINQLIEVFTKGNVSEFGRIFNKTPDTIRTYIGNKGKLSMPGTEFIAELVEKLGISSDWILLGKGDMIKKEIDVTEVTPEFLLKRFEELVLENKKLREENVLLKNQKKGNGYSLVAEPAP